MGRDRLFRTRVFYARVRPNNYSYALKLARKYGMTLSTWLDHQLMEMRIKSEVRKKYDREQRKVSRSS